MIRTNIPSKEVLDNRARMSAYLRKCRETYLITQDELQKQTKLGSQAIMRLENAKYPWLVDTQIRYIMGVIVLAKQKKYYQIHASKTPECSIESMRKSLNIHS